MALNQKEIEALVNELDTRLERLRQLYDQYFLGYEKLEPQVPRKDVERRVDTLRREQIRNTALRFRFTVITQKMNTYQQLWNRTCRAIEDGTYKRHVQRAQKRFGAAAGKKVADIELDIDVDLGELEAEVASDMEAMSDEERRLLQKVEAELRGESVGGDTERPAAPTPARSGKHAAAAASSATDDDDDDDLPTNRPPPSMNMMEVAIPKSPNVPGDARTHTAAPFGNTRPNIRKTDPGAPRPAGPPGASARPSRSTPPPFNPLAPVMPKVPSAHPPARDPASASKIALPLPGRESASMRAAPDQSGARPSTSMRLAPPGSASSMRAAAPAQPHDGARASGSSLGDRPHTGDVARPAPDPSAARPSTSMRAALPVPGTSVRMPPPGAGVRMAPPGARTSPGSPGATSTSSMRAAAPVAPAPTTSPGSPPSNPSIKLPPPGATARGSLPMPGASAARPSDPRIRTDVPGRRTADVPVAEAKPTGDVPPMRPRAPSIGNSKPPPPLPSAIAQRGKQPSLGELAASTQDPKDKDKK